MPDTSVIIPTYNRAHLLEEALASVLAQTHDDLEVIVVDDGSTDATSALLARHVASGRVRALRQGNAGVSAARNAGLRAATGRRIAFLDSDDVWAPTHLAHLAGALDRYHEAAMAFAGFRFIGDAWDAQAQAAAFAASTSRFLAGHGTLQDASTWLSHASWRVALFEVGFPFRIQGSLWDRAFLQHHDLWFDEQLSYTEEAQFVLEAAAHTRCVFCADQTLLVRRHEGNTGAGVYGEKMLTSYERRVRRMLATVSPTVTPSEQTAYRMMLSDMQAVVMFGRAAGRGPAAQVREATRLLRVAPTRHSLRHVGRMLLGATEVG